MLRVCYTAFTLFFNLVDCRVVCFENVLARQVGSPIHSAEVSSLLKGILKVLARHLDEYIIKLTGHNLWN